MRAANSLRLGRTPPDFAHLRRSLKKSISTMPQSRSWLNEVMASSAATALFSRPSA